MADLLTLSGRIIDSGIAEDPQNRITQELSEVTDELAVIESFSHVILLRTGGRAGGVRHERSGDRRGGGGQHAGLVAGSRPHVVYTHGHVDHVGGSPAFVADAERGGHDGPLSSATRTSPSASTATS